MFKDALLKLSDAITVGSSTAAVVSTSYVDTLAKGDDYAGCFLISRVATTIASATTGTTIEYMLQHSDSTAATSFTTLVSSGTDIQANVGVANYLSKLRIPPGTKRYIQGAVRTSNATSSGTVEQFIVKDADFNNQLVA